jgi:hypothetical protein
MLSQNKAALMACRERESVANGPSTSGRGEAEEAGLPALDIGRGQQQQQRYTHLLCISPDAPTNPVLYWLGLFDAKATRFLLDGAKGPLRLDLGDTLYAPNLMLDEQVGALSS